VTTDNDNRSPTRKRADNRSPKRKRADNRKSTARVGREKRTILAMVRIYCRARHGSRSALCTECQSLFDYALCRLDRCPYGAEKTTCVRCSTHCYTPDMRARIKDVMRYAGPRMMLRHPILALFHMLDARRKPAKKRGRAE